MRVLLGSLAGISLVLSGCSAGKGNSEQPSPGNAQQSAQSATPPPLTVAPGEYSYDALRGESQPANFKEICPHITKHTNMPSGEPQVGTAWTLDDDADKIIQNNGIRVGPTSLDTDGTCRIEVSFSGVSNGNSMNFDKMCAVTSVEVDADKSVLVEFVDKNNCV